MTRPLALILYEKILPGTQLVNRMQDLGYRVATLSTPADLVATARRDQAIVVFADLAAHPAEVCEAIRSLRKDGNTSHIPVIALAGEKDLKLQASARAAGATLVVNESAILAHLSQFLDQALQVE
jgi:CheY-like chemotaxis protein